MARELITDESGKVTAVSYIDKTTRTEQQIRCRTVVLAASCCESVRLLLNSRAPGHSGGLANSSGHLGRNLTDNVGFHLDGRIPALEGMPRYDSDGMGGSHLYIPWWLWDKKLDFPRGYHIELGGGFGMPGVGSFNNICAEHEGYGDALKRAISLDYGTHVGFSGRGEMIPNEDTFCEIDPDMVDQWGIPVLRFHFQWTDAELKQVEHMEQTFTALIETMGGRVMGRRPEAAAEKISVGGEIIHEVGAARMGDDPSESVLNRYCQAHDVENLFMADAAPFVSNPDKNPTLTICALAWRTAEYLAEEMRKGNVFLAAPPDDQKALLDKIAYRENATPDLAVGVRFFTWVRRMTVDAYYTSAAGIEELGYLGNKASSQFKVPQEAIDYALTRSETP
jgi:choline dehydrogenase-like flavoprotein